MDITIRHAEPEDYKAIHEVYTQPEVARGTLQLPYSPSENQRRRLDADNKGILTLLAIVDEKVVGHLILYTYPNSPRRRHAGGLGMAVHDAYQGRGIGSALMVEALDLADNWLGLRRLELEVYCNNGPAVHLYEKFGFVIEGRRPAYAMQDGRYVDVFVMGRLKAPPPQVDSE